MKHYAGLCIVLAGTCWGSIGIFVRNISEYGLDTLNIVEMRMIFSIPVVALIILFTDKSLFKIKLKHIWPMVGTGTIGMVFFNFCYMNTIQATSLSVAAVLAYTAPIFVMCFSAVFFDEKITKRKLVALVLVFGGCCMVSGLFDGTAVLTWKGLIVGLGAGVGYAFNTIFQRFALNYGYKPFTIQFYTFIFAAICGLFVCDINISLTAIETSGVPLFIWLVAIALIATVSPNLLYATGLKSIENGKASLLASVEPIMAVVFGIVIFHEIPSLVASIGIAVMLFGIYLVNKE